MNAEPTKNMVLELRRMARQILTQNSASKSFFCHVADRLELLQSLATPDENLKDCLPVVVYFGNESDRDFFIAEIRKALPRLVEKDLTKL